MAAIPYIKRLGTGAVQGQLYETKLISLILFRLLRNKEVEHFFLASNYDGIGAFDDICLKVKATGRDRPIFIFIQAKHKEKDNACLEYELMKQFRDSLRRVNNKFGLSEVKKQNDEFFNGEFNKTDCMFVLYTNASSTKLNLPVGADIRESNIDDNFSGIVNNLIGTSASIPEIVTDNGVKVVIYKNQGNQKIVENKLKDEIADYQRALSNDLVKPDEERIFLYYHNKVQEWWMGKDVSLLLTKANDLYQQTVDSIVEEPQMSAMHNMFYMRHTKYFQYSFIQHSIELLKPIEEHSTAIVVSDVKTLTTIKVIQFLKNYYSNIHAVIDLECALSLPNEDFTALLLELKRSKKVLNIVYNITENSRVRRLNKLVDVTEDKKTIVITDNTFIKTVQDYFEDADIVINDKHLSLMDLSVESRQDIIKDSKILFQGREDCLDAILDDTTVSFVKGAVLDKIIGSKYINIGKSLRDERYEEEKHLYIERRVKTYDGEKSSYIKTFHDIDAEAVLIISSPGMGKTTLLSHLSYQTNECDEKYWIVRINLLEHTEEFTKWMENKSTIDTLNMISFVSQLTLLHNKIPFNLVESNGNLHLLDDTGDDEATFELNLLLHFYNVSKLIFLVDGFDEICPDYKEIVINFIDFVKNRLRKSSMWVTSRSYSEILPDLEAVLGVSYKIEYTNEVEQNTYLKKFWQDRLGHMANKERESKLNKLRKMSSTLCISDNNIHIFKICCHLIKYLMIKNGSGPDDLSSITLDMDLPRNEYLGTPLLLYLLANYLVYLTTDCEPTKMSLSIFTLYETFIETKLKDIFFKDKMKVTVSKPFFKTTYRNELAECMARYKKIGAYTVLRNSIFNSECIFDEFKNLPFNNGSVLEIEMMIKSMEIGKDTPGLISYIINNIPVFKHRTFAEYFAAEFVCDILKSDIDPFVKLLLYTTILLYDPRLHFDWIREKMRVDEELHRIVTIDIETNKSISYMFYRSLFINCPDRNWTMEQNIRVYISTVNDFEHDIEEFLESLEPYSKWKTMDGSIVSIYVDEFLARMKPHLKKYFPSAPAEFRPLGEMRKELSFLCQTSTGDSYSDESDYEESSTED